MNKSVVEFSNQRRVCRSIKLFEDGEQRSWLLASDSMYAHTNMDGKFKVVGLDALTTCQPTSSSTLPLFVE